MLPTEVLRCAVPWFVAAQMAPGFFVVNVLGRVVLRPFSAHYAARFDNAMYGGYLAYVSACYELISGMTVTFHGDDITQPEEGPVLVIGNHQSTLDWVVVNMLASRQSFSAMSNTKFVLKTAVRHLPLYGLYLYLRGNVFVHRQMERDEALLKSAVAWFRKTQLPFWLVLFPEGTRFDPDNESKLQKSRQYAQENGWPEYKYVLAPRLKGFVLLGNEVKDTVSCIYNVTIAYRQHTDTHGRPPTPGMVDFLTGRYKRLEVHFERIPMEEVPWSDEQAVGQWLSSLFARKDKWLQHIFDGGNPSHSSDSSAHTSKVSEATSVVLPPPWATWLLAAGTTATVCTAPWLLIGGRNFGTATAIMAVTSVAISHLLIR